ncbi:MAG TPA: hypothetical protein VN625_05450 [Desulfuromonadaceae bacterium]|nr:hypothetical protein [Desulfuromonadaceae bacterium]
MTKAILVILGGAALAGTAWTGGTFFDPQQQHHTLWLALSLFAWPVLAFGMIFLAQWRGYPGEVGLVLFGAGLLVRFALAHVNHKPLVYLLGTAFAVALPLVVVFALPPRSMPFQKPLKQVKKQAPRAVKPMQASNAGR